MLQSRDDLPDVLEADAAAFEFGSRSDDDTVIASSNTVTANSGTCTISAATADTADVQRYKLQSRTTGSSGGGSFTTSGYFRIT